MSNNKLHNAIPREFKANQDLLDLSGYFTFSFVRHPYDRLVSAYYDKVVNSDYHEIAVKIRKHFGEVSFENFLQYIMVDLRKYYQCQSTSGGGCNFQVDVHWRPFYQRCAYCDINYSFIGRMESFNRDVQ